MLAVAWISAGHWARLPNFYGVCHKQSPRSADLHWQATMVLALQRTHLLPHEVRVGAACGPHLSTTSTLLSHGGVTGQCARPDSCFLSSCHSPTSGAADSLSSRCSPAPHISLDVPPFNLNSGPSLILRPRTELEIVSIKHKPKLALIASCVPGAKLKSLVPLKGHV